MLRRLASQRGRVGAGLVAGRREAGGELSVVQFFWCLISNAEAKPFLSIFLFALTELFALVKSLGVGVLNEM